MAIFTQCTSRHAQQAVVAATVGGVLTSQAAGADKMLGATTTATAAVGSVLLGVNAVMAGYNAYELASKWKKLKLDQRVSKAVEIAGNTSLGAAGGAVVIAKTQSISAALGISKAGAAGASKVAMSYLGPIGLGLLAGSSLIQAGRSFYDAFKAHKEIQLYPGLKNVRNIKIIDGFKHLILAFGLLVGALVMAGLLATPWGWVVLGAVAGFAVLHGVTFAMCKPKEQPFTKLEEEQKRIDNGVILQGPSQSPAHSTDREDSDSNLSFGFFKQ